MEYSRIVGGLLLTILQEIFTELGFNVRNRPQQANGVDLEIFRENHRLIVIEVLNWSNRSRLTDKRKNNIIENLNEFVCDKMLIHSVPLRNLDGIEENGICALEIGYQVLPEEFYDFFLARRQVERRRADSELVRGEIGEMIADYINDHLVVQVFAS